jgi:hypothetical protein
MKVKSIFYVMMLIIIAGCTQQKSKLPQGAWQLVYMKSISGDTVQYEFPGNVTGSDIKMWSENHFLAVGRFQEDTTFMDLGVGGTYKLEGNRYEENVQYHTFKNSVGQNIKMLLELRNDTLIQTWPVDENGQIDKLNYSVEKYIRLD